MLTYGCKAENWFHSRQILGLSLCKNHMCLDRYTQLGIIVYNYTLVVNLCKAFRARGTLGGGPYL